MSSKRSYRFVLFTAFAFALASLGFGVAFASDPPPTQPPCSLDIPETVSAGSDLEGTFTGAGGPVEVEGSYNGSSIGSESSSSNQVSFSFSTIGVPIGGIIEIEALDQTGIPKSGSVEVVP